MSMTTGGGPAVMSRLTGRQSFVDADLMKMIIEGLEKGATALGEELFSKDELESFEALKKSYASTQEAMESGELARAFTAQLSGIPVGEISAEATSKFFEDKIRTPMQRVLNEDILPTISRAYGGFEEREGGAVSDAVIKWGESLLGEKSDIELQREFANLSARESAAQRQLQAIGLAPQTYNMGLQNALALGTVATSMQNRRFQESARMMPENSSWLAMAGNYVGMPLGQIVDKPAELTGFGTALAGIQGTASAASSVMGVLSGVGGLGGTAGLSSLSSNRST